MFHKVLKYKIYDFLDWETECGQKWLDDVINYHINGVYGKSMQLSGYKGYISYLEEWQEIELQILNNLSIKSLIIENAHENRNHSYDKIQDFIENNEI